MGRLLPRRLRRRRLHARALILYTVVRYRGRGSDRIPDQGSVNVLAEVIYTGTPIAIVVVLFLVSTGVERRVTRVAARPAETVRVTTFSGARSSTTPLKA